MKVVFSSAAGDDLGRLAEFLGDEHEVSASRAIDRIQASAESLSEFSDRGVAVGRAGVRRLTVAFGRAAYLLDYRVDAQRQTVTILRVRHSRETR